MKTIIKIIFAHALLVFYVYCQEIEIPENIHGNSTIQPFDVMQDIVVYTITSPSVKSKNMPIIAGLDPDAIRQTTGAPAEKIALAFRYYKRHPHGELPTRLERIEQLAQKQTRALILHMKHILERELKIKLPFFSSSKKRLSRKREHHQKRQHLLLCIIKLIFLGNCP